jgi:xanthine dehydrogenase FAD-binding subunit
MKNVFLPNSIEEFRQIWSAVPDAVLMAGGTDLLVSLREGKTKVKNIISLERISELRHIDCSGGEILIGSLVTHQQILDAPIIAEALPVLRQAASLLGSPAVRHMGTIGGNICTASPAADLLPALYLLDARLELHTERTKRTVPITDFIIGPRQTSLSEGEFLYRIRVPIPVPNTRAYYFKVGQRKALAITIASMAALLRLDTDMTVLEGRFSWGSVGPTVLRFPETEKILQNQKLSEPLLKEIGEKSARLTEPISDIQASADYRRMLVSNFPLRLLQAEKYTGSNGKK